MPFITNELLSYYPLHTDYVNTSYLNVTDYQSRYVGRLGGYTFKHGENVNGVIINNANGTYNKGAGFDAINEKIVVNDSNIIKNIFDNGGTISAWIKPVNDGEGSRGRIISKNTWVLNVQNDDVSNMNLKFSIDFSVSGTMNWNTTGKPIARSTWSYVTVVYNSSATTNIPSVYINGVLQTIATQTPVGTRDTDDGDLLIGNKASNDRTFWGGIDEVRIYNRTLTLSEIIAEMNSPNPIIGEDLVASYSFEKYNTTTIFDTHNIIAGNTNIYENDTAMYFNGKSNYVEFNQTTFQSTNAYSFYFQAKTNNEVGGSNNYAVLGHTDSGYNFVQLSQDDLLILESSTNGDTCRGTYTDDGEWHSYVINVNNFNCDIYEDGINITSTTDSTITDDIVISRIGSRGASRYMNGTIQDVMLFNTTLTQTEIQQLYNKEVNITSVNLSKQLDLELPSCDCVGCSVSTLSNCIIPLSIFSDVGATFTMSNLNVEYNYTPNILVYDIINETLIRDRNISVQFISDDYSYSYHTNTSNDSIILPFGTYTIRFSGNGYAENFDTLIMNNNTIKTVKLYLVNDTTAQSCTATVYDELGHTLESAVVEWLRYDIGTNSYISMGSATSNFEGEATLYLTLNDEYYKFFLYYPIGTLREETVPTYITSCPLTLQINTQEPVGTNFYRIGDIDSSLWFSNNTNNFYWSYSDLNALGSAYKINVYRISVSELTLVNTTSSSDYTKSLILGVEPVNGTTYIAKTYVTIDSVDHFIESASYTYPDTNVFSTSLLGLFVVFVMTFIFLFLSTKYITAIILIPIPLIFGSYMNIVPFGISVGIALEIMAIIIAIIINKST